MERRIDDLGINGLKLIQNPNYFCFGIDAVLLSDFAKQMKSNMTVMDLGCGNGILPLLLSAKTKSKKIYGIEIQKELYELAKENIELNELNGLVEIKNMDIKELNNEFAKGSIDVIVTNPPYKKQGTGLINDNEHIQIAKHEILCTLEDIIKQSSYLLTSLGEFYMVHRPDRLVDIIYLMRKYAIEPKEIKYVHPKAKEEPNLILIKGIKEGKTFLKTLPPLYVYNENGEYTNEILEIYGKDIEYAKR